MSDHAERMKDVFREPLPPPPRRPATLRPDWRLPKADCPECGRRMVPVAVLDGVGRNATFGTYLECLDECCECRDPVEVEWPFEEDRASTRDFRDLGFEVVVA